MLIFEADPCGPVREHCSTAISGDQGPPAMASLRRAGAKPTLPRGASSWLTSGPLSFGNTDWKHRNRTPFPALQRRTIGAYVGTNDRSTACAWTEPYKKSGSINIHSGPEEFWFYSCLLDVALLRTAALVLSSRTYVVHVEVVADFLSVRCFVRDLVFGRAS